MHLYINALQAKDVLQIQLLLKPIKNLVWKFQQAACLVFSLMGRINLGLLIYFAAFQPPITLKQMSPSPIPWKTRPESLKRM